VLQAQIFRRERCIIVWQRNFCISQGELYWQGLEGLYLFRQKGGGEGAVFSWQTGQGKGKGIWFNNRGNNGAGERGKGLYLIWLKGEGQEE
jgi:hypothetical protein